MYILKLKKGDTFLSSQKVFRPKDIGKTSFIIKQAPKKPSEKNINKYVIDLVNEELGEKTNTGKEKLIFINFDDEKNSLHLKLNGDENFNNKKIRGDMLAESKKLFQKIYNQRKEINDVVVNWGNIYHEDIFNVVDHYYVHPAIK